MTATEFMPVAIKIAQDWTTALNNVEVFDGLSLLAALVGLFALSIVCELIYFIQYGEWFPAMASELDDDRHYR
jgi:hypothetical protein